MRKERLHSLSVLGNFTSFKEMLEINDPQMMEKKFSGLRG